MERYSIYLAMNAHSKTSMLCRSTEIWTMKSFSKFTLLNYPGGIPQSRVEVNARWNQLHTSTETM